MTLRIRKEVQEHLKTSLDGTSEDAPASASPAAPQQTTASGAAVGFRDFAAEIETINTLFDLLILNAAEPARLLALRSLTARYLAEGCSEEKLAQVRNLLLRQANVQRAERRNEAPAAAPPMIEARTVSPEPAVAAEPPPQPDRLRRGEVESTVPQPEARITEANTAAGAVAAAAASRFQRLRGKLAGWLGGGAGGGEGRPFKAKMRTALMAAAWVGVGGAALTYAGALVYVNWMRLEIDSALVSGSIEPVNAPFDGSVTTLLVRVGDRITGGQRFMVLEDPEVEKLVKLASVKVERAREDLRLKQVELEAEKYKRDEYVNISKNKMDKIVSDIDALEKQEKVARERFARLSDLFKKGIVIRQRVEDASDKLAEVTTLLAKARINQKERSAMFEAVMAGRYFDGNQVVGRLQEAEGAVARASVEVDLALEELQAMQQRRSINRVVANHDARVLKVLRQEGSAVKRGDTMLVVERMDERVIHAFLRQDEATRVAIGDTAEVYIPALRAKATARVTQVDRNAAFLDDVDARYSWKLARDGGPKATDKDRTARVTLRFDPVDRDVVDAKLQVGMPTVVSFARRSVNTVFSNFSELGSSL
jgi:multidrug resistance efflux pump